MNRIKTDVSLNVHQFFFHGSQVPEGSSLQFAYWLRRVLAEQPIKANVRHFFGRMKEHAVNLKPNRILVSSQLGNV